MRPAVFAATPALPVSVVNPHYNYIYDHNYGPIDGVLPLPQLALTLPTVPV